MKRWFVVFAGIFLFGCLRVPPPAGMVLIPGGRYTIGTDMEDIEQRSVELGIVGGWFDNERPAHNVKLESFYMDIYEVTNNDYKKFVDATGYNPPAPSRRGWQGRNFYPELSSEPVIFVTWDDASYYCRWAGKRLPTEEEWEAAARSKKGYIYPWGNDFDISKANVGGKKGRPLEVGSYEKSETGLYDIIGNVWEWTDSWYSGYDGNNVPDEKFGQKYRVIRGSSWSEIGHYSPEDELDVLRHNSRASFRLYLDPRGITNDIGFRCVKPEAG